VRDRTECRSGRAQTDPANAGVSLRPLALPAPVTGALWLTGLPDNAERLRRYRVETAARRVTHVVILAEEHEVRDLAPEYARWLASDPCPFVLMRLPIRDFGVPDTVAGFRLAAQRIARALKRGRRVVTHCRAGIGRTGMMAVAVLIELGVSPDEATGRVAAAGSACESAKQIAFLREAYPDAQD